MSKNELYLKHIIQAAESIKRIDLLERALAYMVHLAGYDKEHPAKEAQQ